MEELRRPKEFLREDTKQALIKANKDFKLPQKKQDIPPVVSGNTRMVPTIKAEVNRSKLPDDNHQVIPERSSLNVSRDHPYDCIVNVGPNDNHQVIPERSSLNVSRDHPYDCIVNVGLISDITEREGKGWPIMFSDTFYETLEAEYRNPQINLEESKGPSNSNQRSIEDYNNYQAWTGAVVAIVGLYDKGKTFVLNNLTNIKLPSSKRVHTEGLSFKHVSMDSTTNLILLDTAGSYSPVKIENENSIALKEQSENFILDTVFELSDYFICVVNDYTSLDQKFLDKITISLQNTPKNRFKEVIVVHNLKDVTQQADIEEIWNSQVTQIYPGKGNASQVTRITADSANALKTKDVKWFKTEFTRHVFLANNDCQLGQDINPWAFALLKNWLKSIFIPVNKTSSVVKSVLNNIQEKLKHYYDSSASVQLEETNDRLKKIIKSTSSAKGKTTYQQLESSPFIIASPNNFVPLIEITEDRGEYKVFIEIPGLSEEDITVKRHNSTTIVQGMKKRQEEGDSVRIVQSQRKFGSFEIPFKIPEEYERKWDHYEIKNGLLTITYKKDEDD